MWGLPPVLSLCLSVFALAWWLLCGWLAALLPITSTNHQSRDGGLATPLSGITVRGMSALFSTKTHIVQW